MPITIILETVISKTDFELRVGHIQGRTNRKITKKERRLTQLLVETGARTLGLPSELSESTTTSALRSGFDLSVSSPDENEKSVSDRKTKSR